MRRYEDFVRFTDETSLRRCCQGWAEGRNTEEHVVLRCDRSWAVNGPPRPPLQRRRPSYVSNLPAGGRRLCPVGPGPGVPGLRGVTTKVQMSEAQLLSAVVQSAHVFGWLVHHDRPGQTKDGWKTAISGDIGFPDICLARRGRVLFVELKSDSGKLTEGQYGWLASLTPDEVYEATHAVEVWRPADWMSGRIVDRLKP